MKKIFSAIFVYSSLFLMPCIAKAGDDDIFHPTSWQNTQQNYKSNTNNISQNNKQKNDKNKSQSSIVSVYLGAGLGTTGIDIMGGIYYKNFIGIRGNYSFVPSSVLSFLDNTISGASDNITNAKSSFSAGGLDLSIRPFFGAFRIDLGMRIMNYSVSVSAFEAINNHWVQNAGVVGNAKFVIADGVKPYIGFGWDWNPFLGFTIGFDIGVIYTGKWNISKMDISVDYGNMSSAQQATVASEVDRANQEVQDVRTEVNDSIPNFLKFWPVIKLNIGWRFNI